jgi:hypothetical protein
MIPTTLFGFLLLLLAAIVAGFGWAVGHRIANRLLG